MTFYDSDGYDVTMMLVWEMYYPCFLYLCLYLCAVSEHGISLHADIQFNMHDAPYWTLVWLPTISCAYAPGIPIQLLGCNK